MPLITPPNDYGIEPEREVPISHSWEENRRITLFLNVKSWLCPKCGLTNFGRNKYCADWRCKLPRPIDFKLERED